MIRKCTDEDISDEELEKVINPFYDNYHEYIITYVMPEVIAFYIASSFSRNAIILLKILLMLVMMKIMKVLKLR